MSDASPLRGIPSVDQLLTSLDRAGLPRALAAREIRACLAELRRGGTIPARDEIEAQVLAALEARGVQT